MAKLAAGIVGLPNVGKSSLFNALTRSSAHSANYPFCTIDPNIGVVDVPDERLSVLSRLSRSTRIFPAAMQFVDIAGLVRGAAQGEGLGNQFLQHIRETDAILHVVRCFDDPNIIHVHGEVDPLADIDAIDLELCLADLQQVDQALSKAEKQARSHKETASLVAALQEVRSGLDAGVSVRRQHLSPATLDLIAPYRLLSAKPVLYACNLAEEDLRTMSNPWVEALRPRAIKEGSPLVPFCAKLEEELAQLDEADASALCAEMGIATPGLHRIVQASFDLLGLMTFLTSGELETRAWTIRKGTTAPEAAGVIHSDIQRGFIRAEVIGYQDFVTFGGRIGAREAGKLRVEGKEYIVQEGDVINFLHNG